MGSKLFLRSKTIIGVLISILPTLLPALGVSWSADDQAFISSNIDAILTGLGGILAVYGRIDAGGLHWKPGG